MREINADFALKGWTPVIDQVHLVDPVVVLHLDADGLREFRGRRQGSARQPMTRLPWEGLWLQNGRFRLEGQGFTLEASGLFASPDQRARMDLVVGMLGLDVAPVGPIKAPVRWEAGPFVLEDVWITPQRVHLPFIDIRSPQLRLDGSLAIQFGEKINGDLSLGLDLGAAAALAGLPEALGGEVTVDATLNGSPSAFGLGGVFIVEDLIRAANPALDFGDLSGAFEVQVPSASQPGYAQLYDLDWPFADGIVRGEARYDLDHKRFSSSIVGEGLDLAEVLRRVGVSPAPWVSFNGDLEAHLAGTLSPLLLEGPMEIALIDLDVHDGPLHPPPGGRQTAPMLQIPWLTVLGGLRVDARTLFLDINELEGPGSRGHGIASVGIGGNQSLEIRVDLPRFDFSLLRPLGGIGLDGHGSISGVLSGEYAALSASAVLSAEDAEILTFPFADHLDGRLVSPDLRQLQFQLTAERGGEDGRRTRYQGPLTVDFRQDGTWIDTDLVVDRGRLADLSGIFVDLGGLDAGIKGRVRLQGGIYSLSGRSTLEMDDINVYGERFKNGQARAWMDRGRFTLEELLITRPISQEGAAPGRSESVLLRGSIGAGWAMDMGLRWDGGALATLDSLKEAIAGIKVAGALQMIAHIGGTLFSPEPEGRLAMTGLQWDRQGLDDSVILFKTQGGTLTYGGQLLGDAMTVDGSLDLWNDQKYRFDADLSDLPLKVFYPVAADGQEITARMSGHVGLGGYFGDNPTPVDIVGELPRVLLHWGDQRFTAEETWRFEVHGTEIHISNVSLASADGQSLTFEGDTGPGGSLDFRGSGVLDMALLKAFVPGIEEAEGRVPLTLTITRPDAAAPLDTRLDATLDDAYLSTEWFPAAFEKLDARIVATPSLVEISDVQASLGGGQFTSGQGVPNRIYIDPETWKPSRFDLAAKASDVRIQYIESLPPMLVDGTLDFEGPAGALLLSGALTIQDMQFRERVDWESTLLSLQADYLETAPEDADRLFGMDITVSAPETIHLRNNVADADASADLRIIGDTARPGMTGEIIVSEGGRIYLQDREFEVARAEMRYIDPWSFDPDLDFALQTEISTQDQDYRIRYMVNGPFSGWSTSATSDPPMSQADINTLLLFGVTREELERGGYGNFGTVLAVETGGLLSNSLASNSTDIIDRFLNRWTLVSGVTERGSKTVSNEPRLVAESSEIGGFTFTGEFSFSGDWYLSVERRIASRLYAATYATTDQVGRAISFAAVGGEFKLRWELE